MIVLSPMGRAMLDICIVFAQLEREAIQKRVADACFARMGSVQETGKRGC